MNENRSVVNNECMIGRIVSRLKLKTDATMIEINNAILDDIARIDRETSDRHLYSKEAQEVKHLLSLNNRKFRSFKLTRKLYYTNELCI